MCKRMAAVASVLVVSAAARADVSGSYVKVYEGPVEWLGGSVPYIYCYDLQVTVTGDDRWTAAGGCEVTTPWITLTGATFFQHPFGGDGPPSLFWWNEEYDCFYTTPLAFPNSFLNIVDPIFAFDPINEPTALTCVWAWIWQGYLPGEFTIARFAVLAPPDADPATTYADIDMLIESLEMSPPIRYEAHVPIPEPGSLALLALGGLALLHRR
jgi:hypothetical protein